MQYSLRLLLAIATFLSLALALWAWLSTLGILIACGVGGLLLGFCGFTQKSSAMISLGCCVAATVATILLFDLFSTRVWDGHFSLAFDVTIVDADTGNPIPDATVTVGMRGWKMDTYSVDSQGRAVFSQTFPCGGRDSALRITRSDWREIPLGSYQLTVGTSDGEKVVFPLDNAVGRKTVPMDGVPLPPITLKIGGQQ